MLLTSPKNEVAGITLDVILDLHPKDAHLVGRQVVFTDARDVGNALPSEYAGAISWCEIWVSN